MIKGIIFDFNGVIETAKFNEVLDKHALHRGYERDRLKKVLNEYFKGAFVGKYKDLAHFFAEARPSVEATFEEANEALLDLQATQGVDMEMIKLIEGLRPKYKMAILSNYSSDLEDRIKNIFKISHLFDYVANSHNIQIRKPEPEAFLHVLQKLALKPEETIFVDDLEENVRGAENVGIKGIHYKDLEQFKAELSAALA